MRAWIVIPVVLASCGGEEVKIECGNGFVEEGEQCDGDDLNTVTCEGRGFFAGELACNADCTFDTSACTNCGNGVLDAGEACDGTDLGDATCADSGLVDGTLACDAACAFDTSACEPPPNCGNGTLDVEEQCDGAELDDQSCTGLGYLSGSLACTDQCRFDLDTCSGCTDDGFEENDDLANAAALTEGSHAGTLCNVGGVEMDWYSVSLLNGETLAMVVTPGVTMFGFSSGLTDDTGADIGTLSGGGWLYTAEVDITVYAWVAPYLQAPGVGSYGIDVIIDPECLEHVDCTGGQLCEAFACEDSTCVEDGDCPTDFLCHNTECVQCVGAADCGSADWYACTDGRCLYECTADSYELNQTFDAPAAVSVGLDESGLTLCGVEDEDWYEVTLVENQRYVIEATFLHAGGDVDLALHLGTDETEVVAAASSYSDDESMVYAVPAGEGGAYRLRVLLASGDGQTYGLTITDTGVAECFDDDTCTGNDEICLGYECVVPVCMADGDCAGTDRCVSNDCVARPAGDTCADATVVATLPYSTSADMGAYRNDADVGDCTASGTEGNDAIYRVTLAAGDTLVAELNSDFDAALWVASECAAGATCLAGVDEVGIQERLEVTVDDAGDYYVVVDSYAPGYPEDGGFTLSLSLE